MSNEVTRFDRDVTAELLRSAKEHFLLYGYEKASLRKICAGAGVTTGALYFSFKNKEALFDALVKPTLEKLDQILDELSKKIVEENSQNFDPDKFNDFIFSFLIENREAVRLLMARANGSQYEDFRKRVYKHIESFMMQYANRIGSHDVNPEVVHILTHMYFTAMADLMAGDFDKTEMITISDSLRACMESGFYAMVQAEKA